MSDSYTLEPCDVEAPPQRKTGSTKLHDVRRETGPRIGQRVTAIAPAGRRPRRSRSEEPDPKTPQPLPSGKRVARLKSARESSDSEGVSDWSIVSGPDSPTPPGMTRRRLRSRTLDVPKPNYRPEADVAALQQAGDRDIPILPDYPGLPFQDDLALGQELEVHIDDAPIQAKGNHPRRGGSTTHKTFKHLCPQYGMVKIGTHSVHTDGVTENLLMSTQPPELAPIPNYFSHMVNHIHSSSGTFITSDGAHRIQSHLARRQPGGGFLPAHTVSAPVFRMFDSPPKEANIAICEVSFGAPLFKGTIPPEALEVYKRGGVPDERAVNSALNPVLRPADLNVTRHLAFYLDDKALIPNNFMLYAKLGWWLMCHVLQEAVGHAATAVPFPPGHVPTWFDLDSNALTAQSIGVAIQRGDIMFVEGADYQGGDDLQLIYWLTKPGMRLSNADGTQCLHANYMIWPTIPVSVLGHGAAPAPPAVEALSWRRIWAVMTRWAEARCEQQDLMQGMYWVFTHLGIVYSHTEAHPVYEFILPDLGCNNISGPVPTDYNVIARLLRIFPEPQTGWRNERQAFEASGAGMLCDMAALYSYAISVCMGTVFYNYNITPAILTAYNVGNLPASSLSYAVMGHLAASPGINNESGLHRMMWAAFRIYLGVTPCGGITCGRPWSGVYGHRTDAETSYSLLTPHVAPRFASWLALDDWLVVRPVEWGIPGDNTKADFSREIVQLGPMDRQGWYGARGSQDYATAASGNAPYQLCPYGAMAVNVIAQLTNQLPIISAQHCPWAFATEVQWDAPAAGNAVQWVAPLLVLEPGSLMTYDYYNNIVVAPCLITNARGGHLTRPNLGRLALIRGEALDCVGISLKLGLQINAVTTQFHGLSFGSFFGSGTPAGGKGQHHGAPPPRPDPPPAEPAPAVHQQQVAPQAQAAAPANGGGPAPVAAAGAAPAPAQAANP